MTRTISHPDAAPTPDAAAEGVKRDAAPDIVANYRRNSRRKLLASIPGNELKIAS